jgi:hypothetical protein
MWCNSLIFRQRLAAAVDQSWIPWKNVVISFSVGQFALENWLLWRQYGVYKRTVRPKALAAEVDQETYDKSQVIILYTHLSSALDSWMDRRC